MNGYFSRIAKHSGLRFSEPGGGARAGGKKPGSPLPASLGIEETVFVRQADAAESIVGSPEQKPERNSQTAEQRMPKMSARKNQDPAIRENVPDRRTEESALEHERKEVRTESSRPGEREKRAQTIREEKVPAESIATGEMRIVGQTVFADAGLPEAEAQAVPAPAVEAEPFEKTGKKQYFTKTAEVIEQGDLSVAEIQNIVFREVQEWAAASPTRTDMRDVRAAETSGNIVTQKIVRPVPERGVVPSSDETPMERAGSAETSGLEEQSLNLSIGTISVVIEEAKKPVQQTELRSQHQGNQHTRQVPGRQFSRLSRNYL